MPNNPFNPIAAKTRLRVNGTLGIEQMMRGTYKDMNGREVNVDLDALIPIADGYSSRRRGWTGTLVFVLENNAFVELRSSLPDIRGNSEGEAEEVSEQYASSAYGLSAEDLAKFKSNPKAWKLCDSRSNAQQSVQPDRREDAAPS